ncbi:MAG: sigma-70 family RNA polymerase sigma factor [Myxococcota bacterium]
MAAAARDGSRTELAQRLREGDRAAMQAAYAEHGPAVARTVRGLSCGAVGSEDLVQEVFVVAFTRIARFRDDANFGAWLRGIAVNVVRDHRRKESRRRGLTRRFALPAADVPDTPEDAVATRRLADRFWDAVDALPRRQREAFVLRVVEQHSLIECAAALGTSPKGVSRRALAAERRVRAALGDPSEGGA